MARPRMTYVKRDIRECPSHGHTEFAERVGGHGSVVWSCMECDNEASRQYHAEVRAGLRVVHSQAKPAAPVVCCPKCHMVLPACGVCDCD